MWTDSSHNDVPPSNTAGVAQVCNLVHPSCQTKPTKQVVMEQLNPADFLNSKDQGTPVID